MCTGGVKDLVQGRLLVLIIVTRMAVLVGVRPEQVMAGEPAREVFGQETKACQFTEQPGRAGAGDGCQACSG
jgi:hypothetical protein